MRNGRRDGAVREDGEDRRKWRVRKKEGWVRVKEGIEGRGVRSYSYMTRSLCFIRFLTPWPFFAQAKTVNKFFPFYKNIRKTVPIGIDHGEIQISN